jgi:DNA-binding transcriptional regulator YhcF (GntR family)
MSILPLDTLLAIKVISLMEGLRPSERRVATALVEHYNRRTGRCDPSIERLAKLLAISIRTVIRATNRLEQSKLIRKARHGGYSHRNLYEPNWPEFRRLEAVWKEKLKRSSRRIEMSSSARQSCHSPPDANVTQTYLSNLPSETCSPRRGGNGPPSHHPIAVNSSEVANEAAESRWSTSLTKRFATAPKMHAKLIEAIDDALRAEATAIERQHRGAGLNHVLRVLATRGWL